MKCYSLQTTPTEATLQLLDADMPVPGPQEVLVAMHAASLNRGEFIVGHGLQKAGTAKPIGMEGAGEIVQIGTDVRGFKVENWSDFTASVKR